MSLLDQLRSVVDGEVATREKYYKAAPRVEQLLLRGANSLLQLPTAIASVPQIPFAIGELIHGDDSRAARVHKWYEENITDPVRSVGQGVTGVREPQSLTDAILDVGALASMPQRLPSEGPAVIRLLKAIADPRTANYTAKGLAANVGIQAGLNAAATGQLDKAISASAGDAPETVAPTSQASLLEEILGPPTETTAPSATVEKSVPAPALSLESILGPPIQSGPGSSIVVNTPELEERERAGWFARNTLEIAGGIAGLAVLKATHDWRKARALSKEVIEASRSGSVDPTKPLAKPIDSVKSAWLDSSAILQKTFKRAVGGEEAELFGNELRIRSNPAAVQQQIVHSVFTGELVDSKVRVPHSVYNLSERLNRFDQDTNLGAQELVRLRNALNNRDVALKEARTSFYDNKENIGKEFVEKDIRPTLMDMDTASIRGKIAELEAVPSVKKWADDYFSTTRTMLDYVREKGLITADQYHGLVKNRPYYMPEVAADTRSFMERTGDFFRTMHLDRTDKDIFEGLTQLLRRSRDTGQYEQALLDPVRALDHYSTAVQRFAQINQVRRDYINGMMSASVHDPNIGHVIQYKGKAGKYNPGHIVVYRHGTPEAYEVNDPAVLGALKFQPQFADNVFNWTRRAFQATTTGFAAPWFAPNAAIYDAMIGGALRDKGTAAGFIDKALQKSGFKFGLPGDPTSFAVLAAGIGIGSYGKFLGMVSRRMNVALDSDAALVGLLGRENVKSLADTMGEAYSRSTAAMFDRMGMGSARFSQDAAIPELSSVVRLASPSGGGAFWPGAEKLFRSYMTALDMVQNGMRYGYLWMNKGKLDGPEDLARIARQVRELSGDFGRAGSGKVSRHFDATIPYFNVAKQSLSRMASVAARNPIQFAVSAAVGTIAPATLLTLEFIQQSPEHLAHWLSLSPDDQAGAIMLPLGSHVAPEDTPRIRIAPELRAVWAGAWTGMDWAFGFTNGQHQSNGSSRVIQAMIDNQREEMMIAGLLNPVNLPTPPLINTGLALAGEDNRPNTLGLEFNQFGLKPGGGERISGLPSTGRIDDDVIQRKWEAVLTSIGSTAVGIGVSMARAFSLGEKGTGTVEGGVEEAIDTLGIEVGRRSDPFNGVLWDKQTRYTTRDSDAILLENKMRAVKAIDDRFQKVIVNAGGTGGSKSVPLIGQVPTMPHDPEIIAIMQAVSAERNIINKEFAPLRDNARRQMDSIASSQNLSPENKEKQRNIQVEKIKSLQRRMLSRVLDLEDRLSQRFGRPVDLQELAGGL